MYVFSTAGIVLAFFICWAPFYFFRFMVKSNQTPFNGELRDVVSHVAGE